MGWGSDGQLVAVGERSGWWAGFRAECLGWRLFGSLVDGWVKGWESRVIGFGWSGPQLEPTIPPDACTPFLNSERHAFRSAERDALSRPFVIVCSPV